MTFGVTDKGFIQKMFSDIISSIETKGKKYYGADWSLDQYSPEGAMMYVFAYELAENWKALKYAYNADFLDLCTGIQLDYKGKEEDVPRSQGRYANTTLEFTTNKELTIPKGTLVKKRETDLMFSTTQSLVIGPSLKGVVSAVATDVGTDYNSPIDSIVELKNGIVGVTKVTNTTPATGGEGIEIDDRYRARIKIAKRSRGGSTVDTLTSELLKLAAVNNVLVLENIGDTIDSNGLPPGSVKAFIDGTNDVSIANTIHRIVAGGIPTIGDITHTVINAGGQDKEIKFSLMDKKQLYVKVEVNTIVGTLTDDIKKAIKENIISYVENIQVGTMEDRINEIIINQLSAQAYNVNDSIKKVTVSAALTPSPTSTTDIPIPIGQYFYCDETTIEVV
ncbi:MAG: baseplate J/gp47 family protein [Vagococcus fluvialis]